MRTTGATAGFDAGMSIADIAEGVTLHRSYDEARRYVRSYRPDLFDLDL